MTKHANPHVHVTPGNFTTTTTFSVPSAAVTRFSE